MLTDTLIINKAVLIPVCLALITRSKRMAKVAGPFTPARGILLSIYLSILVASGVLLLLPDPKMVLALLSVQIFYKITTPITVQTFKNPIVISNLLIAAFHAVTVYTLFKDNLVTLTLA